MTNLGAVPPIEGAPIGKVVLGSFRLLHVLGQGSFAAAYLAEQIGTDRKAVVKIAHRHLLQGVHAEAIRHRFASEVRAATRVTHPNLVTIYTAGETDDGLPALAMEYLEGETLGARLRRGERLSFEELFRGFAELASALALVHRHKIIHRDVSPDNVFLSRSHDGAAVKLLDFGIARIEDVARGTSFAMMGTPFYVAREQLRGMPEPASDVYSVGSLLWWALTGEEIFSHVTDFTQLVYLLESQREPPDPSARCPGLPAPLCALVRSMLHPEARARPTMSAFLLAWTGMEPEIRSISERARSRRVGLVGEGAHADDVAAALVRAGHGVVRLAPRLSSILGEGELDALVIDAALPEPDPLALVRHLAAVVPDVEVVAFSARPFGAAWLREGLRARVLLPEELPGLLATLAGEPSEPSAVLPSWRGGTGAGAFSERALGEVPELIAGLEEATACGDEGATIGLCEQIERIAHLASLEDLGSLARTLRVLSERHEADDPAGFVAEMTRSFRDSFSALVAAQENR